MARYVRVAALKNAALLRRHLESGGIDLGFDDALVPAAESPFGQPFIDGSVRVGNRFCVLPMEGWDGTTAGEPSDLTRRRWQRFGASGAKLIWGGEAVAVRHDGRANPNQLLMSERNQPALAALRDELVTAHRARFGANADSDLYLGLQLTHSGRFSRPNVWNRPEPLAAHVNPVLDKRFPGGVPLMTDDEIDRLIDDFIDAARRAYDVGFQFVDIKHCHGYFGHELLSARDRDGRYGGSLENRTRFLTSVADGIRAAVPGLGIGVRLSVIDSVPYRKTADGPGEPETNADGYRHGFGVVENAELDRAVLDRSLTEGREFLRAPAIPRHPLGVPDRRQSVLLPARRPARALSARRRLRAARGSAARRGAADSRHRDAQVGVPRHGLRRVGLHLPTGVAAERRPVHAAPWHDRLRRPRPHDAVVSRARGRRARRQAAHAQARVPDVQRLHDGPAARPRLGLLPARPALRRASARGGPQRIEDPGKQAEAPPGKEAKAPVRP